MKNTKTCPKCGCKEIIKIDGYTGIYGTGNNIPVGLSIFSSAPVDRYVCTQCGFSEEWIRIEDIKNVEHSKYAHEID